MHRQESKRSRVKGFGGRKKCAFEARRSQVTNSVSVYYASALYLVLADSCTYTKLGQAKAACDRPEERVL